MAVQFYIEQADRASQSGVADEEIDAGELVVSDGGAVTRASYADGRYDGLQLYDPEFMAAEDEDAIADESIEVGDLSRYHPDEDSAVVHVRTLHDNGTAPSIGHNDVVGIADSGTADADAADVDGRIVEEGYTNGTTTFNRANSNFMAIGRAYRPAKQNGNSVTDFDVPVRVELFADGEV